MMRTILIKGWLLAVNQLGYWLINIQFTLMCIFFVLATSATQSVYHLNYASPKSSQVRYGRLFWFYELITILAFLQQVCLSAFSDETILSVILTESRKGNPEASAVYGVKYKLFGYEGGSITLASYDRWNPFCLQYSVNSQFSQVWFTYFCFSTNTQSKLKY